MPSGHIPTPYGLILLREPIGACWLCEVPWYSERDMRAHFGTIEHRERAQEAITAERQRKARIPFMQEDPDPEVSEHLLKVGERMREEGRWVVRPNERAGFS